MLVVHKIYSGLNVRKKEIKAYLVSSDAEDSERSEIFEFVAFREDLIRPQDMGFG